MWQNKDIYVDSERAIDLLKNISNSDNMSQNSNLQSQLTQNHNNNEHQAAPPQPIYHNSQQRVLQHQSQPIHLNSNSINEGKVISSNKTRRTIIHQQQLPFSNGTTSIQSTQSPSDHNVNSQQQLQQVSNSSVLHSGNISQRIFIQHQPENVNSVTSTNSYSNLQQVRQQQHYVSITGNQQIHTQQLPTHFIQQPHQILISGNNSNQVPQQFIQQNQSSMHQNTQISALSVQQQPSLYIGSQRFYANSVLSATAAISSNSIHSTYGDGILVAAAPPASSTSSNNLNELTAAFGGVKSKEIYRKLKRKFKYLVYENEYYQEELRNLQRKLLKLSRDKNFLLDRLGSYEIVSDSSDDSDASVKTLEDRNTKIRRRNIGNKSVVSRKKNLTSVLNSNSVTNITSASNLKKNNFGNGFTNTIPATTSVSSIMTTITPSTKNNY